MRARSIKPGFFRNCDLLELDPLARILFAGLWCVSDREGRLLDRPKQIKLEVLPGDDCNVDAFLWKLHDAELIARYAAQDVSGKVVDLIQIVNFSKHQLPHHREPASVLPPQETSVPRARPGQDQGGPKANPGPTQGQPRESPSSRARVTDSPFLTPDSCNLTPDSGLRKDLPVPSEPRAGSAPRVPEDKPPFGQIVEYLNEQAGKQYRPNGGGTQRLILARWREGWRLPDFQNVILYKSRQWGRDPKMMGFLRPETLFSNKFESYLQEAKTAGINPPAGAVSAHCSKTINNLEDWIPPI